MNEPKPDQPALLRDASTIILLRQSSAGLEAFLLKRQAAMKFAGGEWVFPGGVVEAADRYDRSLRRIVAPSATTLAALRRHHTGAVLEEAAALAVAIAACRETFEESGVLLARYRNGGPCGPALLKTLQGRRAALDSDPEAFAALLEDNDLLLELDRLAYWSNWITPSPAPRRFDTRFFVIPMPEDQQVDAHAGESQDAAWLPLNDPQNLPPTDPPLTAPPTVFSLRELAALYGRLGSLTALMQQAQRESPATVMVKMTKTAEGLRGLMPWDADYAAAPGEGVLCDDALRQRFAMFPSRIAIDPAPKPPR